MAALERIVQSCQAPGCGRRASHRVLEKSGELSGVYCEVDARLVKKRLEEQGK